MGDQLVPPQAANRLYYGGFKDSKILTLMWAITYGESAHFLRSWHHNVQRTQDGEILRDENNKIVILSTDLGFVQRNVIHDPWVHKADVECKDYANELFAEYPEYSNGQASANEAHTLFLQRGFEPWYAYVNGGYRQHRKNAALAVANFLAVEFGLTSGPNNPIYQIKK